jgi:uncharacterized protein YbjT (DUF2867 family)
MADKKIIAVMGATGAQGGGLVRAILNDPNGGFAARAITRDINSDKAKELAALGAEVVAGDLDNPESINKAFEGAYGAFCVTFFWAHFSPEKEIAHAKTLAEAAKKANVQHVVWSSLEDTRKWIPLSDDRMPTLQGKYKVPHFDAKGEADQQFTSLGLPLTILLASFYWDNAIYFGMGPQRGADGKLTLTLPMADKKLAAIAAADIGKCAYGIFKGGSVWIGKTVGIAGDQLTGEEMAEEYSEALGEPVTYNAVPWDVYRGFGFPGAEDLGNMFQFYCDFEDYFCGVRNLDTSRALNPSMQTFEVWLTENKSRIPIQAAPASSAKG